MTLVKGRTARETKRERAGGRGWLTTNLFSYAENSQRQTRKGEGTYLQKLRLGENARQGKRRGAEKGQTAKKRNDARSVCPRGFEEV